MHDHKKLPKKINTIYLILFLSSRLCAMDFNDGMKPIRSYHALCQMRQEADVSNGDAVVAYRVERRSTFYSRGNPQLDGQDQKIIAADPAEYSRVHYAIIKETTYQDLPPSLFSYKYVHFYPILIKNQPISEFSIVGSEQIAHRHDKCFMFPDEQNYFDKTEFYPDGFYFPVRKKINIISTCDNLRMRAITAIDAMLLLKFIAAQKVSVGWQDQWLTLALKRKFEQGFGFSYDIREAVKQKIA